MEEEKEQPIRIDDCHPEQKIHLIARIKIKERYQWYLNVIQAMLGVVLIIAAIMSRYIHFIAHHPAWFCLELFVYWASAAVFFIMIRWSRNAIPITPGNYIKNLFLASIGTVVLYLLLELAGFNTVYNQQSAVISPSHLTIDFSSTSPTLSDMVFYSGVAFLILLIIFSIGVVWIILRYVHSFKFLSYFANSGMNGSTLMTWIVLRYLGELIVGSFIVSVPMFLTASDRYRAEHRQSTKLPVGAFLKAWARAALILFILQLAGGFDWANKGYCRTVHGFNIRRSEDVSSDEKEEEEDVRVELFLRQLEKKKSTWWRRHKNDNLHDLLKASAKAVKKSPSNLVRRIKKNYKRKKEKNEGSMFANPMFNKTTITR